MDDVKILVIIISALYVITVGLITYIFKSKDTSEAETKKSLGEIKNLLTSISTNIAVIKSELDNNIYQTRKIDELVSEHAGYISALKISEAKMNGRILTLEKQVNK